MRRYLCAVLALLLALTGAGAARATEPGAADYSVADKLLKQLWAGSGFSGTLTVDVAANAGAPANTLSTQKPLELQWDYIYVRDNGLVDEEQRVDLALMDGGAVSSTAHFQLQNGALALQADALGSEWYSLALSQPAQTDAAENAQRTMNDAISDRLGDVYAQLGVPSLLQAVVPVLLSAGSNSDDDFSAVLDSYVTRMDLWIEGYRSSTVMGKLEDGTGTIELSYDISAANIKAQLKQMLLDLLSDGDTLATLQEWLGAEYANLYLHPSLQPYYFAVIDMLPLSGSLTIKRTVSLKGDTLALHLNLPFYDAEGGDVTLRYDRVRGEGDLPDENTLSLNSQRRSVELRYLEYSSMTDVTVVQGALYSEKKEPSGFAVDESQSADAAGKSLAVAFTLRQQTADGKDEQDRDAFEYHAQLSLAPDPERDAANIISFEDIEVTLDATFASQTLKTAPTEIVAALAVGGEKRAQTVTVVLNGRTRKQWSPAETPADKPSLNAMTEQELQTKLQALALNAGGLLLPYFSLGAQTTAPETSAAPAAAEPTTVPEASTAP